MHNLTFLFEPLAIFNQRIHVLNAVKIPMLLGICGVLLSVFHSDDDCSHMETLVSFTPKETWRA